jgi:hypothetical protein
LAEVRLFTSDFVRVAMFVDYHISQLIPLKKIDDSTASVALISSDTMMLIPAGAQYPRT